MWKGTIHDHSSISKIQHSPESGASIHKGEYIKFTLKSTKDPATNQTTPEHFIYVIDKNNFINRAKGDKQGNATVFDKDGNKLKYNPNTKKYE